ncbi:MAG: hypothetical protein HY060_21440 [Proteobacteria bacterium]|nr:hypothetical protein [Pseudomonadota bacterium]
MRRDRVARRDRARQINLVFLASYLAALLIANLLWEIAQLPLYIIWTTASAGDIAFAVAHCTAGDVAIGIGALGLAMAVVRPGMPPRRLGRLDGATIAAAIAYTILSEWLNVSIRGTWAYSPWMPVLPLIGTGLSPLAQWVVTPLVGLWWGRHSVARLALAE